MLVINKKSFYSLLVATIASIIIIGFNYYRVFQVVTENNLQIKYQNENIIFTTILLTIFIIAFFGLLAAKSKNILNILDKVIDLTKNGNYEIAKHLKKSGNLGDKISKIIGNLNELNKLKSLKISSLVNINEYFIRNLKNMTFLLDSRGIIETVNEQFVLDCALKENIFIGKKIDNYFMGINFQEILFELNKNHNQVQKHNIELKINNKEFKETLVFIPLFNSQYQIDYVLCTKEHNEFVYNIIVNDNSVLSTKAINKQQSHHFIGKYFKDITDRLKLK